MSCLCEDEDEKEAENVSLRSFMIMPVRNSVPNIFVSEAVAFVFVLAPEQAFKCNN